MALPQMSAASDNREIIFNGLFVAVEPAALYGLDYENTTGLDLAYFGGQFNGNSVAAGDVTLTDNATNYVVADLTTGVVSDSTSNTDFNDDANYLALYVVTTVAGAITAIVDYRQAYASGGGGGGGLTRTPSVQTVVSSATVTPTFNDDIVTVTAQAAAILWANPTGTAIPNLGMVLRLKDNGTARAITYDTQYRAIGVTLPTTTVIGKTMYLAMIYNSTDTKWDVLAVGEEA